MAEADFLRARRPEQKQQRREAILTAARELATESGVRGVTLGGVAEVVGLAKSNLMRYFGTREEIFLELAGAACEEWEAAVTERLREVDPGGADASGQVVDILSGTLADRPFFCDLLSHTTTTLEHNISLKAARTFKYTAVGGLARLGAEVARACPRLTPAEGTDLVSAASAMAGVLHPVARPSPVLTELYGRHPDLAAACPPFLPTLRRTLAALIVGLPALRGQDA